MRGNDHEHRIGVVMTEHIVAGRTGGSSPDRKAVCAIRQDEVHDALMALPGGELVEVLAEQIASLTSEHAKARSTRSESLSPE